jgi:Acyl-CoA dehydrogenase, C-terminal domain
VPLGIARHAIALFSALAGTKTPTWSQAPLREKTAAQLAVGQAEGLVRSGRVFLTETLRDAWATVTSGTALSWEQRGLLWLASTQAATQAVQAVELLFAAAGASAIYAGFGLERCLRDVRTAAQHICVTPTNFEIAGQLVTDVVEGKIVLSRPEERRRIESLAAAEHVSRRRLSLALVCQPLQQLEPPISFGAGGRLQTLEGTAPTSGLYPLQD